MAASDGYLLGRGYIPATRLNLQQYIWKDTLEYVLHPRVAVRSEGLRIADVGTGTGIWLCHLAPNVPPSSELYGYDVSADQFIPADHLPKNVKLEALDATKEPPASLQGSFDVVHLRLLQIVVNNDDPQPILDHCCKLLKPGGFLQWDEFDPVAQSLRTAQGEEAKFLSMIAEYSKNTKPVSWIAKLPEILEKNGFHVSAVERRRENAWQRNMLLEINAILSEEFAESLEAHGEVEKAGQLRKLIQAAIGEGRRGSYVSQLFQVVVAQKQ